MDTTSCQWRAFQLTFDTGSGYKTEETIKNRASLFTIKARKVTKYE